MVNPKLTAEYVGCFIDFNGGFYIKIVERILTGGSSYSVTEPGFQLKIKKEQIKKTALGERVFNWLHNNHKIEFMIYDCQKTYQFMIRDLKSLANLIIFIESFCILKESKNLYAMKKFLIDQNVLDTKIK